MIGTRPTRAAIGALLIAGLLVAGEIVFSAAAGGATRTHPRLSERRILQLAEHAAELAGDRHPTLIQHGEGTRYRANRVDSGEFVPGQRWSYLIAVRGRFLARYASLPPGARAPRGTVLTLVVDAATGKITDGGLSSRYPDLARLGPVHTDLREGPILDPRPPQRIGDAVWIQATYDARGNPSLVANFAPNGGLATPRWAICPPPPLACRAVASRSQSLEPGSSVSGTVFQATAVYRDRTFAARTAVWSGQVHATRPPWLHGPARAGALVRPNRGAWLGGWHSMLGRGTPAAGNSGGRAPDFDWLSVEACHTRTGRHCVNLTPQGPGRQPVRVGTRFIGWFLFAFDERYAGDTAFASPALARPSDNRPLTVGPTVARSRAYGPVAG